MAWKGHKQEMQKGHKGTPESAMEQPPLPSVPQHPAALMPTPAAERHYERCSGLELRQAMPLHTQGHRSALSLHCLGTRLLRKTHARSSGLQAPHKSVMVEMAAQRYMADDARTTCASSALTFSLILAMLSPITRFCVSRKDFRAAAVPRRKVSPRCCSARSVAR